LYVQSIYNSLTDDQKASVSKKDDNNNDVVDLDKLIIAYPKSFIKTIELT
jgi:hypothetical protein